ncbi:MAG: beta-ketoacyl synthase N-terminal-like domain-containing protein [Myxococcota bacterium]
MDRTIDTFELHERLGALASAALLEAIEPLTLAPHAEVPIYIALPELGPYFSEFDGCAVCRHIQQATADRCAATIYPVFDGNAGGCRALERALASISKRVVHLCVVGGVGSFIHPDLLVDLDEAGRLMSASNKWGFPPGEGAGMIVIVSGSMARSLRSSVCAAVLEVSCAVEPMPMHAEGVCIGEGLSAVFRRIVESVGLPDHRISMQYCDLDGERYRNEELMYALQRVSPHAFLQAEDYIAPADCWGNVGAAGVPLLAILALQSKSRGYARGSRPMVWASSELGLRGAVLLDLAV